jgi:hypothetical protein
MQAWVKAVVFDFPDAQDQHFLDEILDKTRNKSILTPIQEYHVGPLIGHDTDEILKIEFLDPAQVHIGGAIMYQQMPAAAYVRVHGIAEPSLVHLAYVWAQNKIRVANLSGLWCMTQNDTQCMRPTHEFFRSWNVSNPLVPWTKKFPHQP